MRVRVNQRSEREKGQRRGHEKEKEGGRGRQEEKHRNMSRKETTVEKSESRGGEEERGKNTCVFCSSTFNRLVLHLERCRKKFAPAVLTYLWHEGQTTNLMLCW